MLLLRDVCVIFVFWLLLLANEVGTAVHPDQLLSTPELLVKYGYPAESHIVTTEDGYILTMHRIPHSPKSPAAPNKPVVFLQHGLISSSSDWIILGPQKSLGYLLADAGYDVWMGNVRGNTYSKNHTRLSAKGSKYWDFSWHEMGLYDLPAMLDFVLEHTQQRKLNYVGTSMGSTMFFVLTSIKPEYNEKIRVKVGLAPSAFMTTVTTPLANLIIRFILQLLRRLLGVNEFFPSGTLTEYVAGTICSDSLTRALCTNILFLLSGYDEEQLDESMLPVLVSHTPAGTSIKSILHYLQQMHTDTFLQFDYGKLMNMLKYKQGTPPEYNLKAVTTQIALIYGNNDPFADPQDVIKLRKALPNVVELYKVPWEEFNHLDFVWAKDIKTLVNDKVLGIGLLRRWQIKNVFGQMV